MTEIELPSAEQTRRFILHGLCLGRAGGITADAVRGGLEWVLELASEGEPVPPAGFVLDVGRIALRTDRDARPALPATSPLAGLLRAYEDHVLGKLYADATFARAADALRRFAGRDRGRAVAFVVRQFRARAGFAGAVVNAAAVKSLAETPPQDLLSHAWDDIAQNGVDDTVRLLLEDLVRAARLAPDVLAPEDVFELEHGTALEPLGQRVALRQLLRAEQLLTDLLPARPPRPRPAQREVPTHVLDEDVYPVGGFASISNRGGIESLLHSQLAYMEADAARPDLFDVKYLRDELLYYARDENQFLRRRRAFRFVLRPELVRARWKDPELPYQRIILALAGVMAVVHTLGRCLSHEALTVEVIVPAGLAAERKLLELTLRDEIGFGVVRLATAAQVASETARTPQSITLGFGSNPADLIGNFLDVAAPVPRLSPALAADGPSVADEPLRTWADAFGRVLAEWV